MAINFPSSPTLNQEFTADGKTWYWDGEKWVFISTSTTTITATSPITYNAATQVIGINQGSISIGQAQVTNLTTDLSAKAALASPTFTGTPSAPTAAVGTNTTQVATTAFVNAEIANDAVLDSIFTTKGDIIAASGANTPIRVGVGTNGYVLVADSTQTAGVKWAVAQAGATGGGTDQVFYNNDQTVTTSYSIPSGKNAVTAGPVTINSGVTVTVTSGSNWVVV